ncbi:cytochrome P450 [Actinocorallia aurea]
MTSPTPYPFHTDGCPHLRAEPKYSELLADGAPVIPITHTAAGPAWLVLTYERVTEVLRNQAVFSRRAAVDVPGYVPVDDNWVLGLDGDEHLKVRGPAARALAAPKVELLRPMIRKTARDLAAQLAASGTTADLITDYALPLTLGTISKILGVPAEDAHQFATWSDGFLSTTEHRQEEAAAAAEAMFGYVGGLVAHYRANPDPTVLLSDMVNGDDAVDVSETRLIFLAASLVVAGWETTATVLASLVHHLLSTPGMWQREVIERPDNIARLVTEGLRVFPAGVDEVPRVAVADVEFGGAHIKAGDVVITSSGAANLDPAQFPEPEKFDPDRTPNRHVGFGWGAHICPGQFLAPAEIQEGILALADALPNLRIVGDPAALPRKSAVTVRGLTALPVTWG